MATPDTTKATLDLRPATLAEPLTTCDALHSLGLELASLRGRIGRLRVDDHTADTIISLGFISDSVDRAIADYGRVNAALVSKALGGD